PPKLWVTGAQPLNNVVLHWGCSASGMPSATCSTPTDGRAASREPAECLDRPLSGAGRCLAGGRALKAHPETQGFDFFGRLPPASRPAPNRLRMTSLCLIRVLRPKRYKILQRSRHG